MKACRYCNVIVENTKRKCPSCGSTELLRICDNCSARFVGNFCPTCGVKAGQQPRECPECHTKYYSNACPNCGYTTIRRAQQSKSNEFRQPLPSSASGRPGVSRRTDQKTAVKKKSGKKNKHRLIWILGIFFLIVILGNRSSDNKTTRKSVSTKGSSAAVTIAGEKETAKPKEEVITTEMSENRQAEGKITENRSEKDDNYETDMNDANILFIPAETIPEGSSSTPVPIQNEATGQNQMENNYTDDTGIDRYINRYNNVNSGEKIASALVKKIDDNTVSVSQNGFQITLSDKGLFTVIISGGENKTTEDYKALFFAHARVYSADLGDDILDDCWNKLIEQKEEIRTIEMDRFACAISSEGNQISYLLFEGDVE